MDQLTTLVRGYKTFFCFVQIKDVIFPKIPKSTLRSWMKDINISSVPAYPEERDYLKLVIPNLSGAFGLLEGRDLTKLLQLKDRKELRTKQRFSTSTPAKGTDFTTFAADVKITKFNFRTPIPCGLFQPICTYNAVRLLNCIQPSCHSSLDAKSASLVAEYSDATSEDECAATSEPPLKKRKYPSFTGNNFTIPSIITIY
jgi:hypothetical protein